MFDSSTIDVQHHLWMVELEILDFFHSICINHNLKYSLAYGTLLGAIRHEGFIPWDDDIDVMMPREDYNRFLKIWNEISHNGYVLTDENCSSDYNNNFAKIRKDHTTFLQSWKHKGSEFHQGIFIDIIPVDRKASGKVATKVQFMFFAINLLYNRGYPSKAHGPRLKIEKSLLAIVPKRLHRRLSKVASTVSQFWNNNTNSLMIAPITIKTCTTYYPSNTFEQLILVKFQNREYYATAFYDIVLAADYGDYLQLPPEEERIWRHHPVLIDFEHNIEELDI